MGTEWKDDKSAGLINGLGVLWLICVIAPIVIFIWIHRASGGMPDEVKEWGVIGDFVGGLSNPIIGMLTFFGLLMTIIQNQKVLKLNEAELNETRKEIELTREANQNKLKSMLNRMN